MARRYHFYRAIVRGANIAALVIVTTLVTGCRRVGPGVSQQQEEGQLALLWQGEATTRSLQDGGEIEIRFTELKFSPDGNYLAAGGRQAICLWQVQDGRLVATIARRGRFIFSPDSKLLMTEETGYERAQRSRVSRRADSKLGKNAQSVDEGHKDRQSSPISWGVALWRVEDGTQVRAFPVQPNPPLRIALSADGKRLLGLLDVAGKEAKVWRLEDGTLERSFTFEGMPEQERDRQVAAYWPDLQRFVYYDNRKGGVISMWQLDWERQQACVLQTWEAYKAAVRLNPPRDLGPFSPHCVPVELFGQGSFLRIDGSDVNQQDPFAPGTSKLWRVQDGNLAVSGALNGGARLLAVSSDGRYETGWGRETLDLYADGQLVEKRSLGQVPVVSIHPKPEIHREGIPLLAAEFSPDSKHLAVAEDLSAPFSLRAGRVSVFRVQVGKDGPERPVQNTLPAPAKPQAAPQVDGGRRMRTSDGH